MKLSALEEQIRIELGVVLHGHDCKPITFILVNNMFVRLSAVTGLDWTKFCLLN